MASETFSTVSNNAAQDDTATHTAQECLESYMEGEGEEEEWTEPSEIDDEDDDEDDDYGEYGEHLDKMHRQYNLKPNSLSKDHYRWEPDEDWGQEEDSPDILPKDQWWEPDEDAE